MGCTAVSAGGTGPAGSAVQRECSEVYRLHQSRKHPTASGVVSSYGGRNKQCLRPVIRRTAAGTRGGCLVDVYVNGENTVS